MNTAHSNPMMRIVLTGLTWLVGLLFALPLVVMVLVSIQPPGQASAGGADLVPRFDQEVMRGGEAAGPSNVVESTAASYRAVWTNPIADFPLALHNSVVVAVLGVIGMTVSSTIVAYGFSRMRWPGRDGWFLVLLVTLMVPPAVLNAPQYVVFKQLGLIGTLAPLWLPAWMGGAFSIFLLRQFFLTIPRELDEAARMDGASHLRVLLGVIVPLSGPAIITVALLQFVSLWNDFQGPLLFLTHQDQATLSLTLQQYHQQHGGTPWNHVMAASVLIVAPVLALYVAARRFFTEGVAAQTLRE